MKAKDLKLGSICYRPDSENIKSLKVKSLVLDSDGLIQIKFYGESYYGDGHKVKPDAEAIILEKDWMLHIYFSLDAAQTRQRRIRDQRIADAKEALEKAAQHYADTYAKYHDAPASEPCEV
ncbi:MAG: hypothetical protein IJK99_09085 [Bacteroidales bacterium]|nr:hypothetical protein [Bacteroidales bacterium]